VTILLGIFLRIDALQVWLRLTTCDIRWLLGALLIVAFLPVVATLRWRAIVLGMGYAIRFSLIFRVTLAAFPLNAFLPSKMGDVLRAAILRKKGRFVPLAGSVLFERLVDVIVLTAMCAFGAVGLGKRLILMLALGCAVAAFGVVMCLAYHHRLPLPLRGHEIAEDISKAAFTATRQPKTLALVLLWSVLNWLGTMVEAYCLFRAVGISISFTTVLAVLPLAIFVGLLPFTVSGIGTRDGALLALLTGFAAPESVLAVGVLYTMMSYWFLAVLGVPFLGKSMAEAGFRGRAELPAMIKSVASMKS
jgi:uncharacterized membrane protein YbhN (UPF0104 family)